MIYSYAFDLTYFGDLRNSHKRSSQILMYEPAEVLNNPAETSRSESPYGTHGVTPAVG